MVLGLTLAAGCASSTASEEDRVASASAGSQSAIDENQASQARLYLVLSQKELEQGKVLMREGKNHDAAAVLQLAQSDADLSIVKARDPRTRAAAQEVKKSAVALRAGATNSAIGGGPLEPPAPVDQSPKPVPVQPSGPLTPPAQAAPQPHP
jgi:hypothetical protein